MKEESRNLILNNTFHSTKILATKNAIKENLHTNKNKDLQGNQSNLQVQTNLIFYKTKT